MAPALSLFLASAAGLLAGVTADTCFPEYQSLFRYVSQDSSIDLSWDFRSLCTPLIDRVFEVTVPYNWSIYYNVVGNTTINCNPSWPHSISSGTVIQMWGVPPPNCTIKDPELNIVVPCTPDCEVLGHTRPEFDVLNISNPATGGVLLRHTSLPSTKTDKYACPIDGLTGYPRERQVDIHLLCDPGMSNTTVKPLRFFENRPSGIGTCTYIFELVSGAGCGLPTNRSSGGNAPTPLPAPAAATGSSDSTNAGFTVLGAALVVGVQFSYAFLEKRGIVDAVRDKLPGAGYSYKRYATMAATSSSSSSASASGPFAASSSSYGSA